MSPLELENPKKQKTHVLDDALRSRILDKVKDFKTNWVELGQSLYSVWENKSYHGWGYENFEDYVEKEVGIKKSLALKLLKTYLFLEEDEPEYLEKQFADDREANKVPGLDEVNVLRNAKQKKELLADDYKALRKSIFDKGKDAATVRKELTAIMKERKQVDPDEEREKRNEAAIRKLVNSLRSFEKDMEVLKLLPDDLLENAKSLLSRLQKVLPQNPK